MLRPTLVLIAWLLVLVVSLAAEPSTISAHAIFVNTLLLAPPTDDVLRADMLPSDDTSAMPYLSDEALHLANLDLPEASLPRVPREPFFSQVIETAADDPYSRLAVATDAQFFAVDEVASTPGPDDKWIDVNLSEQTITAYVGPTPVWSTLISSGLPRHPTVIGRFYVYLKLRAQRMTGGLREEGSYYDLPGVPNVMYFFQDYAIHGAYWHHNFGHPMSHGCVNIPLDDAQWFYEWAPIGTLVVTHD